MTPNHDQIQQLKKLQDKIKTATVFQKTALAEMAMEEAVTVIELQDTQIGQLQENIAALKQLNGIV